MRQAYFTHAKWGFAVADGIFVGPEALFLGDAFYQQWRVGAHVSGVRVGLLQFGLAGGFVDDRSRGRCLWRSRPSHRVLSENGRRSRIDNHGMVSGAIG